jgi:hypothetical protein
LFISSVAWHPASGVLREAAPQASTTASTWAGRLAFIAAAALGATHVQQLNCRGEKNTMHQDLTVSVCVIIRAGCPMRYHLGQDGEVEFSVGGPRDGFHFAYEAEALRELVKLGMKALDELDTRVLKELAEGRGREPGESALVASAP